LAVSHPQVQRRMTRIEQRNQLQAAWSLRPGFRFLLLCVGVWLYAADTLVTATTAPAMVLEIGGVAYINWTISLYEMGAIIAGTSAAKFGSRYGVKRTLIAAAVLYGAGCAISALAGSIAIVVTGRFVQGLGGGLLLSLCYLAIHEWFAKELWNRMFGIVALIWGVGSLLGPLIGGLFASHRAWRAAFWFFALQAALLWVMAVLWLSAEIPRKKSSHWPVLTLLVLSTATLIIGQAGVANRPVWSSIGFLVGASLLYTAARIDRVSQARLLPVQLLNIRHPLGAGLLMVFALSMATTGFWVYGPLVLKVVFGTNPLISGYILAAEALAWSLATISVSRAPAAAEVALIRSGAGIVAAGAAGFALAVPAGTLGGMVACAILQGFGFGLCWPSVVHRIVRTADLEDSALAAAAPSAIQRIGYAVGAAAAGIAANLSGLGNGISVPAAKAAAFWVFAGFIPILLVALVSSWVFTAKFGERQLGNRAP
jgi:MFS family permease